MEVVKGNFDVIFPLLEEELRRCQFVTMDFEMTGIADVEGCEPAEFTDAVSKHWRNKYDSAIKYGLIQVGVCLFTCVDASSSPPKYEARPFNMWCVPGDLTLDMTFHVETLAVFHTKNGLDFTKWLSQGVPFLNAARAQQVRDATKASVTAAPPSPDVIASIEKKLEALPDGDRTFTTDLFAKIKSFAKETAAAEADLPPPGETSDGPASTPFTMRAPFIRNATALAAVDELLRALGLTKSGQYYQSSRQSRIETMRRCELQVGLRRVFELLEQTEKPVVVHNGMSDLLFMHHWFDGARHNTYAEFQASMARRFGAGGVFDTRSLMLIPSIPYDPQFPQNLSGFQKTLQAKLGSSAARVKLPLGFTAYHESVLKQAGSAKEHEAGYDALLTGVLFLNTALCLSGAGGSVTAESAVGAAGASTPFDPLAILRPYKHAVAVYGCRRLADLSGAGAPDKEFHDGVVLRVAFETGSDGMSSGRIDQLLQQEGLVGRIVNNRDTAFVFIPAATSKKADFQDLVNRTAVRGISQGVVSITVLPS